MSDLIEKIECITSSEEQNGTLKLYHPEDADRKLNLLRFWTEGQRAQTLNSLGFQEVNESHYEIDVDNYPTARPKVSVKINTDQDFEIISSCDKKKVQVRQNSGRIEVPNCSSWSKVLSHFFFIQFNMAFFT